MEKKPREFNSLEETLSSLSKNPLFSTLITFCTLLIIYLPSLFLQILFSPLLISTAILLLTILRLGATQKKPNGSQIGSSISLENENYAVTSISTSTILLKNQEFGPVCAQTEMGFYGESFVEWDVRAPLEVIHEEYEGEGDERNDGISSIERYASLSLYYPESDSGGSSDDGGDFAGIGGWDSPESTCFMWDEEEEKGEDLIEIAFDEKERRSGVVVDQFEEENLIEINISPARVEDVGGKG